jgi:ABC-type branched-subunit amino acid transport system permease subunit
MLNQLRRKKKGQSTLEYIILVTGVIVVLIVFLRPNGVFNNAFNATLTSGTNGMGDMANRLGGSRPLSP